MKHAYSVNQYAVVKEFYHNDKDSLFKALINLKDKNKTSNNEILLSLALNNDLDIKHYKILEKKNLNFVIDKPANFEYFKSLVKVSKVYQRNLIWEYYLEYYQSNQIFLNNVKEYFEKEQINYKFQEKEISLLLINSFTKTIQINPEIVCKYNTKIKESMLENILTGLNNYYHDLAKQIQEDVEMEVEKKNNNKTTIRLNFKEIKFLELYENKLNKFHLNFKEIISQLNPEKNNPPSIYKTSIEKIAHYFEMEEKFPPKDKEKLKKI